MIASGFIRTFSFLLLLCLLAITPVCAAEPVIEDAFAPRTGAEALVLHGIEGAHRSIHVAAYSFTSRKIALLDAYRRGIDVRIVVDETRCGGRYGMARFLAHEGVPVRCDNRYAIMHNKFMVIDQDTLELGSFNYTHSAAYRNAENVLVLRGAPRVAADYEREWERLWGESQ